MSRSEDYLDNLLTSVTDKLNEFDDDFEQNREALKESYQTQNDLPSKTQSALDEIREDNFLKEFEQELRGDDMSAGSEEDNFLREFEQELNGEADDAYQSPQVGQYVDQMEDLIGRPDGKGAGDMPLEVNTLSQDETNFDDLFENDSFGDLFNSDPDGVNAADEITSQITGDDNGMPDDLTQDLSQDSQTVVLDEAAQDTGEDGFSQMGNDQEGPMEAPEGMEGLEDIFGDLFDQEDGGLLDEVRASIEQERQESENLTQQDTAAVETERLDDGLEQILNASDDEAISEIDRLLSDDGESTQAVETPVKEDPLAMGPDFSFDESAVNLPGEDGKKRKKEKNPNSFFAKLSRSLFGTPQELDPEAAAEYETAKAEYDKKQEKNAQELKERKQQEKEAKKQQKKEAAEEKKKEKEAAKAEKAAKKASKPKKEKKPKKKSDVPKEPPLPKVPVIMMWVLALSLMVLIFLGTSLVGYFSPVKESKEAFDQGDYVTAYERLKGIKVKKADQELFHAATALAGIQTELDAYNALMEHKQYELALDALVRGYGRCEVHSAEAEEWGVSEQLTKMQATLRKLLKEQFNVTSHRARKLYKIKKRTEYTMALQEILEGLGLL